jgi:hypothetical protein
MEIYEVYLKSVEQINKVMRRNPDGTEETRTVYKMYLGPEGGRFAIAHRADMSKDGHKNPLTLVLEKYLKCCQAGLYTIDELGSVTVDNTLVPALVYA